tara:strand:+ start:1171 stop:2346 length:1176 start_codon:yes stop_codon:yes gene_type:complete
MQIIIVTNYFPPEIGAASNRINNLSNSLTDYYDYVNIIAPLPNYPTGKIFNNYSQKIYSKEKNNNINIYRYWIYPSNSKNIIKRIMSMLSFATTLWFFAFNINILRKSKWVIIQNSPLLVSFSSIILFKLIFRKKIALNVSDLWPLTALELGVIKKNKFYNFLEFIEKYNYNNSDIILGQSEEIIDHVKSLVDKKTFLYRNLPKFDFSYLANINSSKFKIVYAGLMGVAQGVFDIIKNVKFKNLNVQFDLYGDGNELKKILEFLRLNPNPNITYKGSLPKEDLLKVLPKYNASIVPLTTYIKGAVPSKIFELIKLRVPILFMGKGEASRLIEDWEVGYVCEPKNYKSLELNINRMKKSKLQYEHLKKNCEIISNSKLDYNKQIKNLTKILK